MNAPDTRMPADGNSEPDDAASDRARDASGAESSAAPLAGGEGATPASPETELAALRDRWLRAEAELQNYRRRAQREIEEARRGAEDRALLDVVEYLDDLERALASAREAGKDAEWVQGVELVAQRMRDGLARAGVTPISPVGERFDPRLHEALIEMPAPAGTAPGTVLHVERTGYRRGERVLRAARVTVAAEPARA